MAFTLVGTDAVVSGGTSIALTLPGGWAADDIGIICIDGISGGGTYTAPSGWGTLYTTSNQFGQKQAVFYRILQGGDGNPTVTYSTSAVSAATLVVYSSDATPISFLTPSHQNDYDAAYASTPLGPADIADGDLDIPEMLAVAFFGKHYEDLVPTLSTANGFVIQDSIGTASGSDVSTAVADNTINRGSEGFSAPIFQGGGDGWYPFWGMLYLQDQDLSNTYRITQDEDSSLVSGSNRIQVVVGDVNTAQSASYSAVIPAGVAVGDVMILVLSHSSPGGTANTPSGWTSHGMVRDSSSHRQYIFTRTYVAADPDPSATLSHSDNWQAMVLIAQNADAVGVHDPYGYDEGNPHSSSSSVLSGSKTFVDNPHKWSHLFWVYSCDYYTATVSDAKGFTLDHLLETGGDNTMAILHKRVNDDYVDVETPIMTGTGRRGKSALLTIAAKDQPSRYRGTQDADSGVATHTQFVDVRKGVRAGDGSGSDYYAAIPVGTQVGDLMLLFASGDSGGGTFTTPAGWTLEGRVRDNTSREMRIWSRVYEAGDPDVDSIYYNNADWQAVIYSFHGAQPISNLVLWGYDEGNPNSSTSAVLTNAKDVVDNPEKWSQVFSVVTREYYNNFTLSDGKGFDYTETAQLPDSEGISLAISYTRVTDDYVDVPVPVWTSTQWRSHSFSFSIGALNQPSRYRGTQDQSSAVDEFTDFPARLVGPVWKNYSGTAWGPVVIPPETQPGDVMTLYMTGESGGGTFTTPVGWTYKMMARTNTSRRMQVFTRIYQLGDAGPSGTYSSGQDRMGVVITSRNAAAYHTDAKYGLDEGNPVSSSNATEHPPPDPLMEVTVINSEVFVFFSGAYSYAFTGWKTGTEDDYDVIVNEVYRNTQMTIGARRNLGAGTISAPTALYSPAITGRVMQVSIESAVQPKLIEAIITQDQSLAVTYSKIQGFPIEGYIVQDSISSLTIGNKRPTRVIRPPTKVWVSGLDGVQKNVID